MLPVCLFDVFFISLVFTLKEIHFSQNLGRFSPSLVMSIDVCVSSMDTLVLSTIPLQTV